ISRDLQPTHDGLRAYLTLAELLERVVVAAYRKEGIFGHLGAAEADPDTHLVEVGRVLQYIMNTQLFRGETVEKAIVTAGRHAGEALGRLGEALIQVARHFLQTD